MHLRPRLPALLLALAFATSPAFAQFANRSVPAGLAWNQLTWGAAAADLEGDGDLDLYSGHHYYSPWLYWNDGSGVFARFTHPQPWSGPTDRHGVLLLSLDDDELPEILVVHGADGGAGTEKNELFRNLGGGTFASLANAGGMGDLNGRGRATAAADYDGDGRIDVWEGKAPDAVSLNSLWRNLGGFSFTDVAAAAGVAESLGTVGGLFGDIDDDGDPDLLVGGEEFARTTVLFRNDGGTFSDASSLFSPPLPVISGADFGDYDNDGDLDLAVCDGEVGIFDTWAEGDSVTFFFNTRWGDTGLDGLTVPALADTVIAQLKFRGLFDTSRVFLGPSGVHPPLDFVVTLTDDYVGEPTFTPGVDQGLFVWRDSTGGPWELRCSTPNLGFDAFNGLFTDGSTISGVVPHDLEDPGFTPGAPHVWRNDGGTFSEVTSELGLPGMLNPADISWVDFDNDGDLDLHVVDPGTSALPNAPDLLLRNDGAAFTDVTAAEGLAGSSIGMGDGGIWVDVDDDLDLDLYLQEGSGPFAFASIGPSVLYRNEGDRGGALLLDLVATTTAPPAVGARVTARAGELVVHRRVAANSWRGFQDPLRVHVGLGGATACDSLAVVWPSGALDVWRDLPAGRWRLVEGETAVGVPGGGAPGARPTADWDVASVFPEPSRGRQTLVLSLPRPATLDVGAFDVAGRRIATVYRGPLPAGRISLGWDGRRPGGAPVGSGVYFLRISDGVRAVTARVTRLR